MEGSGKSTLLSGLAVFLRDRGLTVVVTREPGGTPLGEALRAVFVTPSVRIDPLTEALVVNAARAQHVGDVIEPALRAGSYVLCDRFVHATFAYQGYGRGVDLETLRVLATIATQGRVPDLTLLVDVGADVSRARVASRARSSGIGIDRLEREDAAFHERVRGGYLALARNDARIVTLDGTASPGAVLEAACAVLRAKLAL